MKRLPQDQETRKPSDDLVTLPIAVPRSALTVVAAPPELLSQLNCAHVGLDRRRFLDLLGDFKLTGGTVTARGKLRFVDCEALVSWLKSKPAPARRPKLAVEQPANEGAVSLEAELGLVRRAGGR